MWPFKSKPLLDPETEAWHVDNFKWLIDVFGATDHFQNTQLLLPGPGFFKSNGETGHDKACVVFEQVKQYCGMTDWPVELYADAAMPGSERALYQPVVPETTLGMFSIDRNAAVQITYQPKLLNDPTALVATFAHELAHYLLATAPEKPTCEPDHIEFLTDLAAVYLGFGVFLANSAFRFEAWRDDALGTQGWSARQSGYLPESELVFATALFLKHRDLDPGPARKFLKPTLTR